MKIETVFRIYHRLMKRSSDFCAKIVISSDEEVDLFSAPTEVNVKFIPRVKRQMSPREISVLKHFCLYHRLWYRFNENGEMEWFQEQTRTHGKGKSGTT